MIVQCSHQMTQIGERHFANTHVGVRAPLKTDEKSLLNNLVAHVGEIWRAGAL